MTKLADVYQTRPGQRDILYRAWLSAVNFAALMHTGAPIYGHTTLTAETMRRWYLSGIDPYEALTRSQKVR